MDWERFSEAVLVSLGACSVAMAVAFLVTFLVAMPGLAISIYVAFGALVALIYSALAD